MNGVCASSSSFSFPKRYALCRNNPLLLLLAIRISELQSEFPLDIIHCHYMTINGDDNHA